MRWQENPSYRRDTSRREVRRAFRENKRLRYGWWVAVILISGFMLARHGVLVGVIYAGVALVSFGMSVALRRNDDANAP